MARSNVLSEKAIAQGTTVAELVTNAIAQHGSILRAAIALGVAPNSIQNWMKNNGYTVETTVIAQLVPVNHHTDPEAIHE